MRSGTSIDPFSGLPSYFTRRTKEMFFNVSSGRLAPPAGMVLTTQVDRPPLHIPHVQAHPTIASGSSRQATALTVLQPDVPFSPVICASARKNVNGRQSSPAPPCPSPREPSPPTATWPTSCRPAWRAAGTLCATTPATSTREGTPRPAERTTDSAHGTMGSRGTHTPSAPTSRCLESALLAAQAES